MHLFKKKITEVLHKCWEKTKVSFNKNQIKNNTVIIINDIK